MQTYQLSQKQKEEKTNIVHFYESQVETYDILDGYSYWEILYSEYTKWIKSNLHGFFPNIAELGCGTGILTKMLENRSENIFGVDLCEKFLKKSCYTNYNRYRQGQFLPAQVDIMSLPFRANSMDAVVCMNTFDHINDVGGALSEISRICKQNGLFVFDITSSLAIEPYYFFNRYRNRSLKKLNLKWLKDESVPYEWSLRVDDKSTEKIKTYRHSPFCFEEILETHGFKILNKRGIHMCTSFIPEKIQVNSTSRILSTLNRILHKADDFLNRLPFLRNYSMYVLYVCKRLS